MNQFVGECLLSLLCLPLSAGPIDKDLSQIVADINSKNIDKSLKAMRQLDNYTPKAERSAEVLVGLLGHETGAVAESASRAVIRGGKISVPALREACMKKSSDDLLSMAIWCLGEIGPDAISAANVLAKVAKEGDDVLSMNAAYALARIDPTSEVACGELEKQLKSSHLEFRLRALDGLSRLTRKSQKAIPMLGEIISDNNANGDTLDRAFKAIRRYGVVAKELEPLLEKMMADEEKCKASLYRIEVGSAAKRVNPKNTTADKLLLMSLDDLGSVAALPHEGQAIWAIDVIADLGPLAKSLVPKLEQIQRDCTPAVRTAIDTALNRISGK